MLLVSLPPIGISELKDFVTFSKLTRSISSCPLMIQPSDHLAEAVPFRTPS